jgi:hypothetical protein
LPTAQGKKGFVNINGRITANGGSDFRLERVVVWAIMDISYAPLDQDASCLKISDDGPPAFFSHTSLQSPPLNGQRHEADVVSLVPKQSPTAELVKVPMDFSQSQRNDQSHEGDVAFLVPKESSTSELEARSGGPARGPDAGRGSSDQSIGTARGQSVGLPAG